MRHIGALGALAIVLTACGSRTDAPGPSASASASPSAVAVSPSPTPSPAPSVTASPRPNPTAGPGTYISLAYGYRVDLPAGWRRSACQSTRLPSQPPGVETFTSASVDAETGTDTGPAHDVVVVRVEDNAGGQTALGWLESGKMGFSMGSRFEQISFDGNPDAARIVTTDGTRTLAIVVNARFRIYAVNRGMREPSPASDVAARGIMTSLHILRDAELAEARATLATPAPAPARSAEEVADALARGFAQKDTAVLAAVAQECLTTGLENAGAGFRATSVELAAMQRSFANGLVVTIQPRPIEFASGSSVSGATIRGTWTDAGQPQRNMRLMMQRTGNTWYWIGVIFAQ